MKKTMILLLNFFIFLLAFAENDTATHWISEEQEPLLLEIANRSRERDIPTLYDTNRDQVNKRKNPRYCQEEYEEIEVTPDFSAACCEEE